MTADTGWITLGTVEMGDVAPRLMLVREAETIVGQPKAPPGSATEAFVRSLAGLGVEYAGATSGGGAWHCPNPNHGDEHASFDVRVGNNGKPVATCSPCRDAVGQEALFAMLVALGVVFDGDPCEPEEVDWGPRSDSVRSPSGARRKIMWRCVATYDYRHEDGSRNFKVKRYEDAEHVGGGKPRKRFAVERWDADAARYVGGLGTLDSVLRTPYGYEKFREYAGKPLWLVEGEKPADAIVNAGSRATTWHGGVGGKRPDNWIDMLPDCPEYKVHADLDEAGLDKALADRDALRAAGKKANVYCNKVGGKSWVPKGDAVEAIEAGEHKEFSLVTDQIAVQIRALKPAPKVSEKVRSEYIPCLPTREPRKAAQYFLRETGLARGDELLLRSVAGSFFICRGDRYTEIAPAVLGEKVAQFFDGKKYRFSEDSIAVVNVKKALRHEIVAALEGLTLSVAGESNDQELRSMLTAEGGIPFRNGWLDVATGEFGPHRTVRFNTWCVPGDYEPGDWTPDRTPLWVEFLESAGFAAGTDRYRVLRQWFGYVLSVRTNVDRAMVLWGPRRAGKGTVLHVLARLVGDAHVATNMRAMTSPFGLSPMIGKTLATVDDCKWETYDRAAIEKLLTLTAFGEVPINRKYKDEITARLGVRLMIASNDFPKFKQESNAIAGRLLIVPFTVSHYGKERLNLKTELEAELVGIAKWALGGLSDLDANGGRFTVTAEQKEFEDRIEVEGSEVKSFISEACEFVSLGRGTARVPLSGVGSLFDTYLEWARTSNRPNFDGLTKQRFERDLLDHCGSRVEKKADRTKGNVVCIFGLRLRPEFQAPPPLRL